MQLHKNLPSPRIHRPRTRPYGLNVYQNPVYLKFSIEQTLEPNAKYKINSVQYYSVHYKI